MALSLLFIASTYFMAAAQDIVKDSTLREITVEAYVADRAPENVPASIGILRSADLGRFSNASLLPAVNTIPGVRMEERSPGSYRFSIRGSTLRSPFGVRNVKIYWNGLALTDGGGNTYINLVDLENVGGIEVIKGPGGSLYGAGTGGVVLLKSPVIRDDRLTMSVTAGSYGLLRFLGSGAFYTEKTLGHVSFVRHRAEGYRQQSAMERTSYNFNFDHKLSDVNSISATVFYTDLFYETPGGLTLAQFEADPSQARPAAGMFLGAEDQNAHVKNKTLFGGVSHHHDWNEKSYTVTSAFGSNVGFDNPSIREYETRNEQNLGLRSVTKYFVTDTWNLSGGGEYQFFRSPIAKYENNGGIRGNMTADDDLVSTMGMLFFQSEADVKNWLFTVGLSANFSATSFDRVFPEEVHEKRSFDPFFSPRLAVMRDFGNVTAYGSFSNGFSPPTIADLYPSTGVFDRSLKAEHGNNLEIGLKGNLADGKVKFNFSGYQFGMKNTIVARREAVTDAEYFVNAGKTTQRGVELFLEYMPVVNGSGFVSDSRITAGYTYNHFRFEDYIQATNQGPLDYSGNKITGVPPTTAFVTFDLSSGTGLYANFTANYVDHIPLNDANTAYAEPYVLVGARAGHKLKFESGHLLELFAGVQNATDQRYSLGNDLNAAGGRYFNAATPRSFYGGMKFDFFPRRK
ncbi:MAG TPA: TonB-dependent receptor plug domain-containing protein [Chryseosolibacter sp.]|nr:TonB-dependent receptor plug domain-containing protein [Chryseosolibacter sp.]